MRVWDRAVRTLHWSLAAAMVLGWATTAWFGGWHQRIGYAALAIVVARLVWSRVVAGRARLTLPAGGIAAIWRYARLAAAGRAPRHVGHNPLGTCMAIAFFVCVAALALTGWLYTTDRFWGDETVELVHRAVAWTVVVLAVVHVAGVIVASVRHRENLVAAMLHGSKREAKGDDID